MNFLELIKLIGLSGVVDILLMSVLLYFFLIWFKRKKAAFVMTGIIISGFIYLLAHQFNLFLIASVLQAFFAVILIAIIVIFQEELRSIFEQIAVWSFNRKLRGIKGMDVPRSEIEILVRTLTDLSRERIGALIILKGRNIITRFLQGGVELDGSLSEALLKSLFDPHSIGHDGAVVLEGSQITHFGCHLPLSNDFAKLGKGGTRHAAGLGLAELSDALCLIVSEERGTISVANEGELTLVTGAAHLQNILENFYRDFSPLENRRLWSDVFRRNYREKLAALGLSILLWFVLVHQTDLVYQSYTIPIEYPKLASDIEVEDINPDEVTVTFSGPRNVFHFVNDKEIRVSLKTLNFQPGKKYIYISESNLTYPKEFTLEGIEPRRIEVKIIKEISDKEQKN